MTPAPTSSAEIGIDTGGTFTDVVCSLADGSIRIAKIPSTRGDPSRAVLAGIAQMLATTGLGAEQIRRVVHGTTVATNAIIERKGAKLGLITTAGFRDVLEIGRQMRRQLYELELEPQTPVFLAPRHRRREVRERLSAQGAVVMPLDDSDVEAASDALAKEGVGAIAVVFLFSYLNPDHERRARQIIQTRHPHIMVSLSCEVDPAMREYERSVTTAFDAYVKPVIDTYLANLERGLADLGVRRPLQVMQSRGGISSLAAARARPVRLLLSGPAAGVVGGQRVGRLSAIDDIITVDVGGTSCDIALVSRGKPIVRAEGEVDGFPVRVPMVDVNAIGAGGGSIAWIDSAGGLRVGPHSAGSDPGPACYGRGGTAVTVTDASIVLGWIDPDFFAGGTLKLHRDLAVAAVRDTIAVKLGLDLKTAALGIHRVVNSQMAEGIRLVSIRQGFDPRQFTLVPAGGAGPIHATALAAALGIRRILVPQYPGVMAASGLLAAAVEQELTTAFAAMLDQVEWPDVCEALARLDEACANNMQREAVERQNIQITHFADLCYAGQTYHLEVEVPDGWDTPLVELRRRFQALYARVFGQSTESPICIAALRSVHSAAPRAGAEPVARPAAGAALKGTRTIVLPNGEEADVPIFDRASLPAGFYFDGPAIVEQSDTTTLVESGWTCRVERSGNLMMEKPE